MLEETGLGELFGKASSANTAFVSCRFVFITSRRPWMVERWLRYSSGAWPYEALKRGLPRPVAKRRKKLECTEGRRNLGENTLKVHFLLENSCRCLDNNYCSVEEAWVDYSSETERISAYGPRNHDGICQGDRAFTGPEVPEALPMDRCLRNL
jgi:hypothetical protein